VRQSPGLIAQVHLFTDLETKSVELLNDGPGDLRTGLPWQSVHDGERFVHEPMRLNVVIEAPIAALNAIIAKHPSVRALLDNGWLHLWALDDSGAVSHRYMGNLEWESMERNSRIVERPETRLPGPADLALGA
jgi:uncharacterized protein YbcC (UPF0753/DUF2309 family)